MFDLFIEEGLERELTDHTSALYKKYDSLFARIYFLKKEGIYNPKDENTVKLIMSKDSYWKIQNIRNYNLILSLYIVQRLIEISNILS